MSSSPFDILILSNGPGELATWVRPVVQALRDRLGEDRSLVRISLVLSPCPNASGREGAIAQQYAEIDRIQGADRFWPFLLTGQTAENWDWRDRGLVIFLGGDQFFPVVIGRRLGYRTVTYAEWEVRWPRWIDRFGLRRGEAIAAVPEPYRSKCRVVGDLMVEAKATGPLPKPEAELVGLLAGSKAAKLTQGVPFFLLVAEVLHRQRPQTHCFIPMAPSLAPEDLLRYAQAEHNPMVTRLGSPAVTLEQSGEGSAYLQTSQGTRVELYRPFPAYDRLAQCDLCLTTVGANTAELAALAVPMLVLLPTQQLDAMRAWNGIPGLLANLPGLGSLFAKLINGYMLRRLGLLAWPNIWAGEMIVPELVGALEPGAIAQQVIDYLGHPAVLKKMQHQLRAVCGETGAAAKLVELAMELMAGDEMNE
jgi:hypothetical protein